MLAVSRVFAPMGYPNSPRLLIEKLVSALIKIPRELPYPAACPKTPASSGGTIAIVAARETKLALKNIIPATILDVSIAPFCPTEHRQYTLKRPVCSQIFA